MDNKIHCETDMNKVAEIYQEWKEKAFKYDCLIKKLKQGNEQDKKRYNIMKKLIEKQKEITIHSI